MTDLSSKNSVALFPIKGFVAVCLLRFIYWLPTRLSKKLGPLIGWLTFKLSVKKRNIISTNLKFAYPEWEDSKIDEFSLENSQQTGLLLSEFAQAWFGSKNQISEQVLTIKNDQLIKETLSNNQAVIIATPHIGNWEFLAQWIQINFPMTGMYSPSKLPQMDQLILDSRSKFGGKLHSTDAKGILKLLRNLKKGGLTIMLPDQVPKNGAGTYTPFFGQPAYTMTLLNKLVQKTNAKIIFAVCVRSESEKGFNIAFESATFNTNESDIEIFNVGLNQQLERLIKRYPKQYAWDYKRYKQQKDGKLVYTKNQ
jgi:KDO2-lipid IV(A) lauroyltransferase